MYDQIPPFPLISEESRWLHTVASIECFSRLKPFYIPGSFQRILAVIVLNLT